MNEFYIFQQALLHSSNKQVMWLVSPCSEVQHTFVCRYVAPPGEWLQHSITLRLFSIVECGITCFLCAMQFARIWWWFEYNDEVFWHLNTLNQDLIQRLLSLYRKIQLGPGQKWGRGRQINS